MLEWQHGGTDALGKDCVFKEWIVRQIAGDSEFDFVCSTDFNAPNCTATNLLSNTKYQFKMQLACALATTTSPWSEVSLWVRTVASTPATHSIFTVLKAGETVYQAIYNTVPNYLKHLRRGSVA